MDDVLKEMQEKYYKTCLITGLTVYKAPHVSFSDLQRCINKIKALQSENEKLNRMVNCRYNHEHTITGVGYCSKCGWYENLETNGVLKGQDLINAIKGKV